MKIRLLTVVLLAFVVSACSSFPTVAERKSAERPLIFPDYVGVTVPKNIAPLNFMVSGVKYINAYI